MRRCPLMLLLLLLFILPVTSQAQFTEPGSAVHLPYPEFKKPSGFLDYLLDPSKLSVSHSYSVMMTSMGGESINQGLYLSTLNYQFSDPLSLQVRVGYTHQPFGGLQTNDQMNNKFFLQQARLDFRPSDKTHITLEFQQIPTSMMYSPYGYRYYR